jgi:P-type E1-E2 ATPase
VTVKPGLAIEIRGRSALVLHSLVLDLNGTIARDGRLIAGVEDRVAALNSHLDIYVLTADTLGTAGAIAGQLGCHLHTLAAGADEAEQKAEFVRQLGAAGVAAFGNGANDMLMLKDAALGIAVLGPEGLAVATLQWADVVVSDINDALDLLLTPKRLIATLRR